MIFSVILFLFSLTLATTLIVRKALTFRANNVAASNVEETNWHDLSIESIRTRFIELVKFTTHHSVLILLKMWILGSNWVKRTDKKIKDRLMNLLHHNARYPEGGKPSRFIKHIREHKDEVMIAIQKEVTEEAK